MTSTLTSVIPRKSNGGRGPEGSCYDARMPAFFVFLVAFAGIGGKQATKIDQQVLGLLDGTEVEVVTLTKAQRASLMSQADDAPDIVKELGMNGVIIGEVARKKKGATLTVLVYDGEGAMIDLIELPFGKKKAKKLPADDLDSLRETLLPDVERLNTRPEPEPEPEPEPVVADASPIEQEPVVEAKASGPKKDRAPWLSVTVGAGPRMRHFEPGPAMALGYDSNPVPAAQVGVEVSPVKFISLAGELERTLIMNSDIGAEKVPTSITGWQATAAARLRLGSIELAALGGLGGREFVIDADDAPTPDGHYVYALVGGRIALKLGKKVELRGFATFQPVIGGEDTMDAPGEPSRVGLEAGGALEVAATRHVFVVGEGGYQRFTWTWEDGSAVDEYPSGTLSLGARY